MMTTEGKELDRVLSFSISESEEIITKGDEDEGIICTCGHSARHHEKDAGFCSPGRQECRCNKLIPILKVSDTRFFMRKSQGNGKLHALSLGLAAAALASKKAELIDPEDNKSSRKKAPLEIKWNPDICCMKCLRVDVGLSPTMLSLQGQILYDPDELYKDKIGIKIFNLMLCDDCIDEVSTVRGV
jgi:hypothetical protein